MLKTKDRPVELPLREYADLMMIHSDNMATDLVIRTVGTKATNQFLDDQGCKNTRVSLELGRWHYMIVGMTKTPISRANDQLVISRMKAGRFDNDGLGYSDSLKNNVCGPRDTGLLLERLYLGGLANHSHTDEMLKLLEQLASFDPGLQAQVSELQDAAHAVSDVGRHVGDYAQGIDHDPRRLAEVRARLDLIFRLKRKYGPELADVLATAHGVRTELAELGDSDHDLELLRQRIQATEDAIEGPRAFSEKRPPVWKMR